MRNIVFQDQPALQKSQSSLKTGLETSVSIQSTDRKEQSKSSTAQFADRRLRQKRSQKFMDGFKKLDLAGINSQIDLTEVISLIHEEFGDLELLSAENKFIGIVGKCYIDGCDVHGLTFDGQIFKHWKYGEPMPADQEKARSAAASNRYSHIEIYKNYLICVSTDGSTSVV